MSQELCELLVAEYGEKNEITIHAGKNYAIALVDANRGKKTVELSISIIRVKNHQYGAHHTAYCCE